MDLFFGILIFLIVLFALRVVADAAGGNDTKVQREKRTPQRKCEKSGKSGCQH